MSDVLYNRNFKGALDSITFLYALVEALAENLVDSATASTLVIGHVLYKSNSWHFELVKHLYSFNDVHIAESLRSSHNNCGSQSQFLPQSKLDVASPRWKVYNQVIEVAPIGLTY